MLTTTRPKKITINYRPLPKQKAFHQAQNKFTGYIGGLGSGKTYAGAMKAVNFMLSNPGSQGMIAAPNYPMLRKSTMPTFFEILPPELIKNYHKTYHELELINGAKTFFVSTEKPDHLRGPNLSWWWYDEASSGSRTSFDVLVGRLRVGKAKAWVTGTPKGFNWVYERFADPIKKLQDTFLIASSSRENTYLPSDYVPMLERTYTGAFAKQEIEGEFVGFEGLVYPDFSYEAHCRPEFPIEKRGLPAYVGVDFGYTNPSALILVTVDSDDRIWIWEEFYQSGVFVEELIKQIKTWQSQGFNIHSCFCDPSEPAFIQQMQLSGLPAVAANNSIRDGIRVVTSKLAIRQDGQPALFVREPYCTNLLNEFRNYRYPDGKEGKPLQENPIKLYDHALDAFRYMIMGINIQGEVFVVEKGF